MSMFTQVTSHVIKGETTLHACRDLNSAQRFSTLCVVERRRAFWFWKQPVMIPTFCTLKDLFQDSGETFSAKEKEFTLVKQVEDTSHHNMSATVEVDAKLAKKIAAQADVSLGGDDTMNLDISLGDIIKSEVSYETLREELKDMRVDIQHPVFVQTAQKSPKSSLCLVLGTLMTKTDHEMKKDDDVKINTSAGANIVKINVQAKGSMESKTARSYEIPSGTVLAYECNEIDIDEKGAVTVHGVSDTFDQSVGSLELPEKPFTKMKEDVEPLLKSKNVHRVQEELKSLLATGTEMDFRTMHVLLYYASLGDKDRSMKLSKLAHLLGAETPQQHWKSFMELLGFVVESCDGEQYVVYPTEGEGVVKAALQLVDCVLDCFGKKWNALPQLSLQHIQLLMKVIENNFSGKPNQLQGGKLKPLKGDEASMGVLKACGFRESPGGELTYAGNHRHHLLDVYVVMYFFAVGSSCHCAIV